MAAIIFMEMGTSVNITDCQAKHRELHCIYTKWHATYAYASVDGTYSGKWWRSGIVCVRLTAKAMNKNWTNFRQMNSKFMWTKLTAKIPSTETDTQVDDQEFPSLLWYWKVHYRVHNSLPLNPILSQLNPLNALRYISSETHAEPNTGCYI
jgi:hypothetical protein